MAAVSIVIMGGSVCFCLIQKINDGIEYLKIISQSEILLNFSNTMTKSAWIKCLKLLPDTMERYIEVFVSAALLAVYDTEELRFEFCNDYQDGSGHT